MYRCDANTILAYCLFDETDTGHTGWSWKTEIIIGRQVDALVTVSSQLECTIAIVGGSLQYRDDATRIASYWLTEYIRHTAVDGSYEYPLPGGV